MTGHPLSRHDGQQREGGCQRAGDQANNGHRLVSFRDSIRDDYRLASPSSAFAIAVMVFQLRVVTGTPKIRSSVPR